MRKEAGRDIFPTFLRSTDDIPERYPLIIVDHVPRNVRIL
jgi:hypothetical protein